MLSFNIGYCFFAPIDITSMCAVVYCLFCAVRTGERLSQNKESDTAYSDLCSKIASANSIPSKHGASDTDGHNACMPEARGTEVAPELPQHNAYQPDQFSMKSCSTTSQPSGVAEKYEYSTAIFKHVL